MLTDGEAQAWRRVFDFWREAYDEMSYATHQRFYNMVAEAFPDQDKADRNAVESALIHLLATYKAPLRVWELGGWDGALARDMIAACGDGIARWRNMEICQRVVERGWDDGGKVYFAMSPSRWIWKDTLPVHDDIAILSHVIEHLSWAHLHELIRMLQDVPFLYIQTPKAMGMDFHPTNWMGTLSTHKLEVGWEAVYKLLDSYDYKLLWTKNQARFFGKKERV